MWVIFLIVGFVIGFTIARQADKNNRVGSLIIDTMDPMNDQPFLLELNKSVNDVYGKKHIVLDVVSR